MSSPFSPSTCPARAASKQKIDRVCSGSKNHPIAQRVLRQNRKLTEFVAVPKIKRQLREKQHDSGSLSIASNV